MVDNNNSADHGSSVPSGAHAGTGEMAGHDPGSSTSPEDFASGTGEAHAADSFDDVWSDGETTHYEFCDHYSLSYSECVYDEVPQGSADETTAGSTPDKENLEALKDFAVNAAEASAEIGTEIGAQTLDSALGAASFVGEAVNGFASQDKNDQQKPAKDGHSKNGQADSQAKSEHDIEPETPEPPETAPAQTPDTDTPGEPLSDEPSFADTVLDGLGEQLDETIGDVGEIGENIINDPVGSYLDYVDTVVAGPAEAWATNAGETLGAIAVGLDTLKNDIQDHGMEAVEEHAINAVESAVNDTIGDIDAVGKAYTEIPEALAEGELEKAAGLYTDGVHGAWGLSEKGVGAGFGIKSVGGLFGIVKKTGKIPAKGFKKKYDHPDSDGRAPRTDAEKYADKTYREARANGDSPQKAGTKAHDALNARGQGPDFNTYGPAKHTSNPAPQPGKAVPYMEEAKFHKKVTSKQARAAERQVQRDSARQQRETGLVPITKTTLYEVGPKVTRIFNYFRSNWVPKKGK